MQALQSSLRAVAVGAALATAGVAAFADSNASVQITSFSYAVNGGTLVWTGTDGYSTLYDTAGDVGGVAGYDYHSATNFTISNAFQSSTTSNAGAFTYVTSQRTQGNTASSLTTTQVPVGQPNSAAANSTQADAFTLVGADSVTFTVGYAISVGATNGNFNDSYAEGVLDFSAGSYLGTSGGVFDIDKYSFDSATGMGTYSGFLTTTVTLNGAEDIGYYALTTDAYAFSPSTVPEPTEAAMLLAALGVLATLARRRRDAC